MFCSVSLASYGLQFKWWTANLRAIRHKIVHSQTYLHLTHQNKSQTFLQTFEDSKISATKDQLLKIWKQNSHKTT